MSDTADTTGGAPGGKRREAISHAEFARFVQEAKDMRRERDESRAALAQAEERTAALVKTAEGMASAIDFAIGDPDDDDAEAAEEPDCVGRMADALSAYRALAAAGLSYGGGGERGE